MDGTASYTYCDLSPLTHIDPSGRISISLSKMMKPQYVATCTGDAVNIMKFPFAFQLDAPAPCNGFFFQWVRIQAWIRNCTKCAKNSYHNADWDLFGTHVDVSYWEWFGDKGLPPAGLIPKGKTGFVEIDAAKYLDERRFKRTKPFPSCGIARWESDLRFYCQSDIKMGWGKKHDVIVEEYPHQFWTIGVNESGTLPSTGSQPDFWSQAPVESSKWMFIGLYDCCCGNDIVTGKAYDGISSFSWDSWSDWTVIGAWP